jgi:hypothetical protein
MAPIVMTWHQAIFTCSLLRKFLGGKIFRTDDEVNTFVKQWLNKQPQTFFFFLIGASWSCPNDGNSV